MIVYFFFTLRALCNKLFFLMFVITKNECLPRGNDKLEFGNYMGVAHLSEQGSAGRATSSVP